MSSDMTGDDDCCASAASHSPRASLSLVGRVSSPLLGSACALIVAFFPRCPVCWAAYLSLFGVASADWLTESPWLLPLFVLVLLSNVGSLWWLGKRSGRRAGFQLAALGALVVVGNVAWLERSDVGVVGIALTALGSLLSVRPLARELRQRSALRPGATGRARAGNSA